MWFQLPLWGENACVVGEVGVASTAAVTPITPTIPSLIFFLSNLQLNFLLIVHNDVVKPLQKCMQLWFSDFQYHFLKD